VRVAVIHRSLEAEVRHLGEEGGTSLQLLLALRGLGAEVFALTQSPEPERFAGGTIGGLDGVVWHDTRRAPLLAPADKALKLAFGHRKLATDALRARRALSAHGPFDAILAFSEEPDGLLGGALAALGERAPLVVGIQALRYAFRDGAPRFDGQRALRFGFRRARRVVANSPMVAEDLQRHYGVAEERLAWVPPNLTRRFLDSTADAPSGRASPPTVLFLGAINEKKGADVFLDAAALLARARADLRFRMVGGITDPNSAFSRSWRERVGRAALGPRLVELGHVPPSTVASEVRAAAVAVLPSRMDEFSRAAVEALALGTPVVMTSRMGAAFYPERDGSGRVVPPGDARALADGVRGVLDDPRPRERAAAAAGTLREELSPARVAEGWLRVLQGAAGRV
jgi:glycosyltransferase involved in cell wall biosynthesis